ncbi:MAG: response regulator transcription factor [Pseudobacteriovorax sp.]|nr:response regulator transcription factor [Pseudobacteriovorax sp.]
MRVLVVDDEAHARQSVIDLLQQYSSAIDIVEACDGVEAVEIIAKEEPDLVILDVEMPAVSGFDVLRQFPNRSFDVIFVTAYSEFAVEAFEQSACDYIMKPLRQQRFNLAMEKHRRRRGDLSSLNRQLIASGIYMDSFFIKIGSKANHIFTRDIPWIEASQGGTDIHLSDRSYGSDFSLALFEEQLDPRVFFRVRRNIIVNRKFIERITFGYPIILHLYDGTEIRVAKDRRSRVRQWLESTN